MKSRLFIVLSFVAVMFVSIPVSSLAAPPTKEELSKIYKDGAELFKARQWDAADQHFVKVLRHIPNQPQSLRYRAAIREERRKEACVPSLYKELAALQVEEVNFDEATLEEALEFVSVRAKELSKGKTAPNFVLRGDDPQLKDRKVTFKMGKIPLSALLDQIGKFAKTKFVFEEHAIVGTPTADPKSSGVSVVEDRKSAPTLRAK